MPITPNTQPETTVDKNGKTTTVHRKTVASKSGSTKPARSVPSPAATATQDAEFVIKNAHEVKVGDIVWDGEVGFVVSEIRLESGHFAPPGTTARPAFYSARGQYWLTNAINPNVVVLRDEDVLQQKIDDLDESW